MTKNIFQSKTVWAGILTAVVPLLLAWLQGVEVTPEMIGAALTGVAAVTYGRAKADIKIRVGPGTLALFMAALIPVGGMGCAPYQIQQDAQRQLTAPDQVDVVLAHAKRSGSSSS